MKKLLTWATVVGMILSGVLACWGALKGISFVGPARAREAQDTLYAASAGMAVLSVMLLVGRLGVSAASATSTSGQSAERVRSRRRRVLAVVVLLELAIVVICSWYVLRRVHRDTVSDRGGIAFFHGNDPRASGVSVGTPLAVLVRGVPEQFGLEVSCPGSSCKVTTDDGKPLTGRTWRKSADVRVTPTSAGRLRVKVVLIGPTERWVLTGPPKVRVRQPDRISLSCLEESEIPSSIVDYEGSRFLALRAWAGSDEIDIFGTIKIQGKPVQCSAMHNRRDIVECDYQGPADVQLRVESGKVSATAAVHFWGKSCCAQKSGPCVAPRGAVVACSEQYRCGHICSGLLPCATGCCPPRAVAVGATRTCLLSAAGKAICTNEVLSHSDDRSVVGPIVGLPAGLQRLVSGRSHYCAVDRDGGVWCWRDGKRVSTRAAEMEDVKTDDGKVVDRSEARANETAVRVAGLEEPALNIFAGGQETCAWLKSGELWCWGSGSKKTAALQGSYARLAKVALHGDRCVLTKNGDLTCTGDLATEANWFTSPIRDVAVARRVACALTNKKVACWRARPRGQGGRRGARPRPRSIDLPEDTAAIFGAATHVCAVSASGGVHCWDADPTAGSAAGWLGTPKRVEALPGPVEMVAVAARHSCARTRAGEVWCWGSALGNKLATVRRSLPRASGPVPIRATVSAPARPR